MVKKNMTMLLKTTLIGAGLSLSPGGWGALAAPVQMGTSDDFKSCTRQGPGWWECVDKGGKKWWCPKKNSPKKDCTDVGPLSKPPRGKAPGGALFPKREVKPLLRPQEKDTGVPNPNVRIAPPPRPDLIVTIGSGMPPYFVVRNIGKGSAGASVLKIDCTQFGSTAPGRKCIAVFRNYGRPDQIPVWKNVPALATGGLHTISLESVDTDIYSFDDKYTFRAEADARRQVAEKNETNNKDTRVVDKR